MSIEWTGKTWNPVRGCSRVSPGCVNCYAERIAARHSGEGRPFEGFAKFTKKGEPRWTRKVALLPEKLREPLRWKHPQVCFVNSMSDLFHEKLRFEEIAAVFGIMAVAHWNIFQVLTKRASRVPGFFLWLEDEHPDESPIDTCVSYANNYLQLVGHKPIPYAGIDTKWPLQNVWLGTSVEDQNAVGRIPHILRAPAALHFASVEPLLEEVSLPRELLQSRCPSCGGRCHDTRCPGHGKQTTVLGLVIVGGESGPGARDCHAEWIEGVVNAAILGGSKIFVKQLGSKAYYRGQRLKGIGRRGQKFEAWPEEVQCRKLPDQGAWLLRAKGSGSGRSLSASSEPASAASSS